MIERAVGINSTVYLSINISILPVIGGMSSCSHGHHHRISHVKLLAFCWPTSKDSCSWSAEKGKLTFPHPSSGLKICSRKTGSTVPSSVSLLIIHAQGWIWHFACRSSTTCFAEQTAPAVEPRACVRGNRSNPITLCIYGPIIILLQPELSGKIYCILSRLLVCFGSVWCPCMTINDVGAQ